MILTDIRLKNTIYSLVIITSLSLLAFSINKKGDDFNGIIIILLTEIVSLFVSVILILLRFSKTIKYKSYFWYNYFSLLNILISIFSLTSLNIVIILINGTIGIFMMLDIYVDFLNE